MRDVSIEPTGRPRAWLAIAMSGLLCLTFAGSVSAGPDRTVTIIAPSTSCPTP